MSGLLFPEGRGEEVITVEGTPSHGKATIATTQESTPNRQRFDLRARTIFRWLGVSLVVW
jgi:hypothetical protein